MVDGGIPLFSAVATSARQLFFLLRCVGFATKVEVRITSEGLRFSVAERGVLEAFIFLSKDLFTTYRLAVTQPSSSPGSSSPAAQSFTLALAPLLSTLQILTSASEPQSTSGFSYSRGVTGPYSSDAYSSSFAAHRLNRHSLFSGAAVGAQGQCRIVYRAEGSRLEISVPETGGVRTASELATFVSSDTPWAGDEDDDQDDNDDGNNGDVGDGEGQRGRWTGKEIPFDREDLRLKVILPSSVLGDALIEVGALGPPEIFVVEGSTTAPYLVLRGESGAGGECRVEFGDELVGGPGRSKLLETFQCASRVRALYSFATIKKALVALRAGTKVSLRVDGVGVLSLQILVEMGESNSGPQDRVSEEVAFVDIRIVPLYEQGAEDDSTSDEDE